MVYATGGYVWQDADLTLSFPGLETGRSSEIIPGWTVGGGLSWAIRERWISSLGYRYTRSDDDRFQGTADFDCCTYGGDDEFTFHAVRAALSYKFGSPPAPAP